MTTIGQKIIVQIYSGVANCYSLSILFDESVRRRGVAGSQTLLANVLTYLGIALVGLSSLIPLINLITPCGMAAERVTFAGGLRREVGSKLTPITVRGVATSGLLPPLVVTPLVTLALMLEYGAGYLILGVISLLLIAVGYNADRQRDSRAMMFAANELLLTFMMGFFSILSGGNTTVQLINMALEGIELAETLSAHFADPRLRDFDTPNAFMTLAEFESRVHAGLPVRITQPKLDWEYLETASKLLRIGLRPSCWGVVAGLDGSGTVAARLDGCAAMSEGRVRLGTSRFVSDSNGTVMEISEGAQFKDEFDVYLEVHDLSPTTLASLGEGRGTMVERLLDGSTEACSDMVGAASGGHDYLEGMRNIEKFSRTEDDGPKKIGPRFLERAETVQVKNILLSRRESRRVNDGLAPLPEGTIYATSVGDRISVRCIWKSAGMIWKRNRAYVGTSGIHASVAGLRDCRKAPNSTPFGMSSRFIVGSHARRIRAAWRKVASLSFRASDSEDDDSRGQLKFMGEQEALSAGYGRSELYFTGARLRFRVAPGVYAWQREVACHGEPRGPD